MLFASLGRAVRRALPRVAAATAVLASGCTSPSPRCVGESEMLRFVKTAGGTDGQYGELSALGLASPMLVLSYNGGAFKSDPPRAADFTALLGALHAATSLTGEDAWVDPATGDASLMRRHL